MFKGAKFMAKKVEQNNQVNWIAPMVGALFFFYAFIQCNMLNPLHGALQAYFQLDTAQLGILGAFYFYGNVIFLIPAGLLLDRLAIHKIFFIGMVLGIVGAIIFAFSTNIYVAAFGRFLSGMMMAWGLIACLKLASLWLKPTQMALASSLVVSIGMVGGIVSQAPIAYITEKFSWQISVSIVALIGILIFSVLSLIVRAPTSETNDRKARNSIVDSLLLVAKNPINWLASFFICFLNIPVAIFGALFGAGFLTVFHQVSSFEASSIVSMLFLGMILGSPFFGWLAQKLNNMYLTIFIGTTLCAALLISVLFPVSSVTLYALFFFIGFTSGAQVLGYPVITRNNTADISGTAMSLGAIIIMGVGYGLGLPFFGKLIDMLTVHFASAKTAYFYVVMSFFLLVALSQFLSTMLYFYEKKETKRPA